MSQTLKIVHPLVCYVLVLDFSEFLVDGHRNIYTESRRWIEIVVVQVNEYRNINI